MNLEEHVFNGMLQNDQVPLINIGCGVDYTIRELSEKVAGIVGYSGDVEWDHERPDGTPQKLLDINRIKGLGWQPKVSLEKGIELAYQNYLARL
jgi:GDP-L-fucose synthase